MNCKAVFQVICIDRYKEYVMKTYETEEKAFEDIKDRIEMESTGNPQFYIRKVYKGNYGL